MQAFVYTQYGPPEVLRLAEVVRPTPGDDEVLVKVAAASINAADWHMLRGEPYLVRLSAGLRRPRRSILGADVAGRVETVGKNVKALRPGDEVFGDLSGAGWGGFAQYVCGPERALAVKPAGISFAQAAATPMAAVTALQGLRKFGPIQAGQQVLVHGASGGVGSFAVQLAKVFGAEVTAVCSTRNVETARTLGADHVIDYMQEDFAASGRRYDLIFAANGDRPLRDYKRALKRGGAYVMGGGSNRQIFEALLLGPLHGLGGGVRITTLFAQPSPADLGLISGLLEAGRIAPVIDRCYPLSRLVEALGYVDEGHARGKVVITVDE